MKYFPTAEKSAGGNIQQREGTITGYDLGGLWTCHTTFTGTGKVAQRTPGLGREKRELPFNGYRASAWDEAVAKPCD